MIVGQSVHIDNPQCTQGSKHAMDILLLSVHPVLEYDEVSVLESLGHRVFSLGFYLDRNNVDTLRPKLAQSAWSRNMLRSFVASGCGRDHDVGGGWRVTPTFTRRFDVCIVHHNLRFLDSHPFLLESMRVIWRGIGQEPAFIEQNLRRFIDLGMKVVRWSPAETKIDGYCGHDAVIRPSKDEVEWSGWSGETRQIISFSNNFLERAEALSLDLYRSSIEGLPSRLYGLGNEDMSESDGLLPADEQIREMRSSRILFCTGTIPASYTLGFIEAWMLGIPVVHIGRAAHERLGFTTFEVDDLIEDKVSGFVVDTAEEAREAMNGLLDDHDHARKISKAGRDKACSIFGRRVVRVQWRDFLEQI